MQVAIIPLITLIMGYTQITDLFTAIGYKKNDDGDDFKPKRIHPLLKCMLEVNIPTVFISPNENEDYKLIINTNLEAELMELKEFTTHELEYYSMINHLISKYKTLKVYDGDKDSLRNELFRGV